MYDGAGVMAQKKKKMMLITVFSKTKDFSTVFPKTADFFLPFTPAPSYKCVAHPLPIESL